MKNVRESLVNKINYKFLDKLGSGYVTFEYINPLRLRVSEIIKMQFSHKSIPDITEDFSRNIKTGFQDKHFSWS